MFSHSWLACAFVSFPVVQQHVAQRSFCLMAMMFWWIQIVNVHVRALSHTRERDDPGHAVFFYCRKMLQGAISMKLGSYCHVKFFAPFLKATRYNSCNYRKNAVGGPIMQDRSDTRTTRLITLDTTPYIALAFFNKFLLLVLATACDANLQHLIEGRCHSNINSKGGTITAFGNLLSFSNARSEKAASTWAFGVNNHVRAFGTRAYAHKSSIKRTPASATANAPSVKGMLLSRSTTSYALMPSPLVWPGNGCEQLLKLDNAWATLRA